MYIVQEQEVRGNRMEAPYAREVKHLVAQWNAGAERIWLGISVIEPGSASNPHSHAAQEEVFYCLSGTGRIQVGAEEAEIGPGSCVFIPVGVEHQLINPQAEGVLRVLSATAPPFSQDGWAASHR